MTNSKPTRIVFVCQSNRGKSAMAAGLFAAEAARLNLDVEISSVGTKATEGASFNPESAESLSKLGASMGAPNQDGSVPATAELLRSADRVIVLGTDASLDDVSGADEVDFQRWAPRDPSEDGFEGSERMDRLATSINNNVRLLAHELNQES